MALIDLLNDVKREYGIDEFANMLNREPNRVLAIMSDSKSYDRSIVPLVIENMVSRGMVKAIANNCGKENADDVVNMCIEDCVLNGIQRDLATEYIYAFADIFELKYSNNTLRNSGVTKDIYKDIRIKENDRLKDTLNEKENIQSEFKVSDSIITSTNSTVIRDNGKWKSNLAIICAIVALVIVIVNGMSSNNKTNDNNVQKGEEVYTEDVDDTELRNGKEGTYIENKRKILDKNNGFQSTDFGYYENESLYCEDNRGVVHKGALIGFADVKKDSVKIIYDCEGYTKLKGEVFVPRIYKDSTYIGYFIICGDDVPIYNSEKMSGIDKSKSFDLDISNYETISVEVFAQLESMQNRSPAIYAYFE